MVNTRSTNKDTNNAGDAFSAQAGRQQPQRAIATSSHVNPIPPWACPQPASAPPVASRAPWNGIRAPLVPPTSPSAISRTLSVPGSSLAPPAPPPNERCWGGILTPNAFHAEFGGQDHSSSASRCGKEGSSAAQDQQVLNPGSSHSRIFEFDPFAGSLPPPCSPCSQGHAQPNCCSHSPCRQESCPTPQTQGSAAPAAEDTGAGSKILIANNSSLKGTWGNPSQAQLHSYMEPFQLECITNNLFASRFADSSLKSVDSADASAIILDSIDLNNFNSLPRGMPRAFHQHFVPKGADAPGHRLALGIADMLDAMFNMVKD
ncbi:hypothetical protein BT96DRAFT_996990 [Gymnopus androsaceus JB14]|uniref:Uncharacterized protein n=1 Tax=Gymnopus androsaceus JB14 TaxID=1447944 RepID=A0A6A4HED3_9AGAR|nr:hypothetical protein BT96DRAFT_996990 [Gymnopus androsaceus JB14]